MDKPCLVQINCTPDGSTGNIMEGIRREAEADGWRCYTLCAGTRQAKRLATGNRLVIHHTAERGFYRKLNKRIGHYAEGFPLATRELLRTLTRLKPDVLQLHNLHHQFFDVGKLFAYIKQNRIRVVWTLHDCWAFTGLCTHFQISGCEKWRTGCGGCPSLGAYPTLYRDGTKRLYALKKQWFTGVDDLRLVATSRWMEGLIRQSFLKDYPVTVLHHGIDLTAFRPAEGAPARGGRRDKPFVALGVAFTWTYAKGLDVWASLAARLDGRFQIVLAGEMPAGVSFPPNVTCLGRIGDARRLAEVFASADVFFNPTREEALGLVNVEALACGTPVITFNTGGSPECVDPDCGVVLDQPTWEAARDVLERMASGELVFRPEACLRKAAEFDERRQLRTYLTLYRKD